MHGVRLESPRGAAHTADSSVQQSGQASVRVPARPLVDARLAGLPRGQGFRVRRDEDRQTHVVLQSPRLRAHTLSEFVRLLQPAGSVTQLPLATGDAYRLHDVGHLTPELRNRIGALGMQYRLDIAEIPGWRDIRLVGAVGSDMDSTLVLDECIDAIAAKWQEILDMQGGNRRNIAAEVKAITERAMRGELDFAQSLAERVALLEGFPVEALEAVYRDHVELSPGAMQMLSAFKAAGALTGVLSGGFTFFTGRLQDQLRLDFAEANELTIRADQTLAGTVDGKTLDPQAKADILGWWRAFTGKLSVAFGDGANDVGMLAAADVGVAYRAKPGVAEAAKAAGGTVHELRYSGIDAGANLFLSRPQISAGTRTQLSGTNVEADGAATVHRQHSDREPIHFDPGLIRRWSQEDEDREPLAAPFMEIFSRGGKQLYFYGVKHVSGYSATLQKGARWMDKLNPDCIIVEGAEDQFTDLDRKSLLGLRQVKEPHAFARYAVRHDPPIRVLFGEPGNAERRRFALGMGYTDRDLFGELLLRDAIFLHRTDHLRTKEASLRTVSALLRDPSFASHIPARSRFSSLEEFSAWYDSIHPDGQRSDWWAITSPIEPSSAPHANRVARLKADLETLRSPHILHTIEHALNRYDNVMIAYGYSHLPSLRPALEQTMESRPIESYAEEWERVHGAAR